MSGVQGRSGARHGLEESEHWLREKIESLRAMNEASKVALQATVERQGLFIEALHDIADKQRALAGRIAGAPACDVVPPRGSELSSVVAPRGSELSTAGGTFHSVSEFAATGLSVRPAATRQGTGRETSSWAHTLKLRNRRDSFIRNLAALDHRRLPTIREIGCFRWARLATGNVLHSRFFGYFIALCVLANTISIGVEIDRKLLGRDTQAVAMLEYFFVSIYIAEMGMRFFVDGPGCLRNGWVLFDFVLVLVGGTSVFFGDRLVSLLERGGVGGGATGGVEQLMVLRVVRLFRLARALRVFSVFKWKLIAGFVHSLKTMASTVVLMTVCVYFFACLGAELITKDEVLREDAAAAGLVSERFASVPGIMLTLLQFATMDSISSIYYPLIMLRPWLCAYFMAILLTLSIAVMNLVTALIVEDALESTARDAETKALSVRKQVKKMIPIIKDLFRSLDSSGDGCIQIDEIVEGIQSDQVEIPKEMRDIVSLDRLVDLFEFLDLDGSGELDEDEFVDGLCHLAITSVPVETTQILQLLRQQRRDIGLLCSDVHHLERRKGSRHRVMPVASRASVQSSYADVSI